jgi:uncharacterized protein YndB with AHSA1/START domain
MSVTQHTVDGRPALRLERRLNHPIERVWRAVTEPGELRQWFVVAEVPWTPAAGEEFEAAGERGRIDALDPPRLLAWTWGVERYSFELSADGTGCRLVFTHAFDPSLGPAWQHAAGWDTYFDRLDAHLAGGFLSEEDAHAGVHERMDKYRAAFAEDRHTA